MADNMLSRYRAGFQYDLGGPPQNMLAGQNVLKEGPAPTGWDRVFDAAYNLLGGRPENRATANFLANAFDVGTLGMATGAYDGARDLALTGRPAALAMALMPGAKVGGQAAKAAGRAASEAAQGIRAFHGSPHDFDRFDMSKVGTGEGAQAFGHGLYFAENEGVAKQYRKDLSPQVPRGERQLAREYTEQELRKMAEKADDVRRMNLEHIADQMKDGKSFSEIAQWMPYGPLTHTFGDDIIKNSPGRLYEVRIDANPENFLDWDKPLSQQSEKVRRAFPEDLQSFRGADAHNAMAERLAPAVPPDADSGWTGVVNTINDRVQRRDLLTQRLREAGIPGIRYLDQGSRGAGEGSRNYVVFDDALIEILRKYGVLPPALFGAAAASQTQPTSAAP